LQRDFLRTFPDDAVRQTALRLFGPVPLKRPEVVQQFAPALSLNGESDRGRAIFVARCAACHRSSREARGSADDLVAAKIAGRNRILSAILEPNADLQPERAACVLETAGGESLIGRLLSQNPIALGRPNGAQIVLPRTNVRSLQIQTWSLMPTGLEEGLSTQDMADLLEYVMTLSP
jgi:putative heme-binding domain-containing protein